MHTRTCYVSCVRSIATPDILGTVHYDLDASAYVFVPCPKVVWTMDHIDCVRRALIRAYNKAEDTGQRYPGEPDDTQTKPPENL